MKIKGALATQMSGSIGGITASHNSGGQYLRARAVPTDPGTVKQTAVRALVSQLVNAWGDTLTAAQRNAWETYAQNVPLTDVFGDARVRTGLNHYVRSNLPLLQAGGTRVDDAPTDFNMGTFSPPTPSASEATQNVSIAFTEADAWRSEDDAHMLIYVSRPVGPTINFFKGPYQYAGKIDGDSTTPPTSPQTVSAPFAFVAGQRLHTQVRVVRADGRMSSVARNFCDATA
jgi:hypothetical protein